VLYLYRDSHVSLVGHLAGRLPGFHSLSELAGHVVRREHIEVVERNLWTSSLSGLAAALPLSYPPLSRRLTAHLISAQLRRQLDRLQFDRPLLWFYWWFYPELVHSIPHRLAVYDMYDDHSEYDYVRSDPRRKAYSEVVERRLLRGVDLAFGVSRKLVCDKAWAAPVRYLPNGVDIALANAAAGAPQPPEMRDLPRPIVGYLGSYDSRLDWDLVETLAGARPSWSFVFVGGGYTAPRQSHANLHLLGNRSYPEALRYVNAFDLALIPFVRDRLTDAVCPAKLFDYLALGKPVLSTPLPAVSEIAGEGQDVYRGETVEEFLRNAGRALREDEALPAARRALAASLTWEVRAERAMSWIEECLSWKEGTG
jgi:glycosyltransferase involved in cell wall biosynthesis